ncbi:nuclear transport factor 2 family protein [Nocardia thraciensis]
MTYPPGEEPYEPRPQPQQSHGYSEQQPPSYYPPEGYPSDEDGCAARVHAAPHRKRHTAVIVAAVLLAMIVAGGGAATAVVLTSQGIGPLASDEKKIEVAIRDFYRTLDAEGADAAMAKSCRQDRAEYAELPDEERAAIGGTAFSAHVDTIEDITVTGDRATARVRGTLDVSMSGDQLDGADTTTEQLRKEDGDWKVCTAKGG